MAGGLTGPAPDERPHPEGRRNILGTRIDPEAEAEPATRRTVLSALVAHEPGVLAKVSGLFARRQFNIESLTVGATQDDGLARITLVIEEPGPGVEQAKKQLEKLMPVRSVNELDPNAIRREIALIKVDASEPEAVKAVADMYDAKIVDASDGTATIEATGSEEKIEAAIETLDRFGVREIARAGTVALARGAEKTA